MGRQMFAYLANTLFSGKLFSLCHPHMTKAIDACLSTAYFPRNLPIGMPIENNQEWIKLSTVPSGAASSTVSSLLHSLQKRGKKHPFFLDLSTA